MLQDSTADVEPIFCMCAWLAHATACSWNQQHSWWSHGYLRNSTYSNVLIDVYVGNRCSFCRFCGARTRQRTSPFCPPLISPTRRLQVAFIFCCPWPSSPATSGRPLRMRVAFIFLSCGLTATHDLHLPLRVAVLFGREWLSSSCAVG